MQSHSADFDSWNEHSKYVYKVVDKDLSLKLLRKSF